MKPASGRLEVNLDELDGVLEGARQAPLSEADYDKLKGVLHALAAMLVRPRPREKTSAVLQESEGSETGAGTQTESNSPPPPGHGRNAAEAFGGARRVGIAHQKLTFDCRQAAGFCSDIGNEDEGYFDALVRMFEQALQVANTLSANDRDDFVTRLNRVRESRPRFGYGVGDDMDFLLSPYTRRSNGCSVPYGSPLWEEPPELRSLAESTRTLNSITPSTTAF